MLKRIKLTNFKAWQEADLQLGKVTAFFGSNSAGKSSLLQLLLLLKQTRNATDRGLVLDFDSSFVNLGTFVDVIHRHDLEKRLSWHLEWSLPKKLECNIPTASANKLQITGDILHTWSEVGLRNASLWPYELGYKLQEMDFRVHQPQKLKTRFVLDTSHQDCRFIPRKGHKGHLSSPIKTHLFPEETRYVYQDADFLDNFEFAYEELMDSIYYLGPLRKYPEREYQWGGSNPSDVGQHGERTIEAILAATRNDEERSLGFRKRKKKFQEIIAYWLKELGLIHDFRLEEIATGTNLYRAIVKTSKSGPEVGIMDVGFGVSQVLPALVLLYLVPEGSIVLMEQPEIHLHPAVQSKLADVMLNVAEARNVQIVVESHSEQLLRRLQRRVAEAKQGASSETIQLYFVTNDGLHSKVSDLRLNQWGEIENWPAGFFGDEMEEIAAIAKASLRRKMEIS